MWSSFPPVDTALNAIRGLCKVAHFGRIITRTQQAGPFTTCQSVQVSGILVEGGPALLLERAHRSECTSDRSTAEVLAGGVRIIFSTLSNCEQTTLYLFDILPFTFASSLRPEGGDIVICRTAWLSQDLPDLDLGCCCECGSANLVVCDTSKALRPLCAQRAHSPWSSMEHGRILDTIADEGTAYRLNRRRCAQVNLTDARQRAQKGDLWSVNAAGDCSSVKFSMT